MAFCQCFPPISCQELWPQVNLIHAPKSDMTHSGPPLPFRGIKAAVRVGEPHGRWCSVPPEPSDLPWLPLRLFAYTLYF